MSIMHSISDHPTNTATREQQIDSFFNRYAIRFNQALVGEKEDIDGTIHSFADSFIAASPLGVASGKNDESFRNALLQGYTYYKNIGITSMNIVSKQITLLDDFHAMTKLKWKCDFIRKDGSKGNVNFDVIYFTQTLMNEPKIFAYITGDEQAALKSCGLI